MQNINSTVPDVYCRDLAKYGEKFFVGDEIKKKIMFHAMNIGVNFVQLKFPTVTTIAPNFKSTELLTKGSSLNVIINGTFSRVEYFLSIGHLREFRESYYSDLQIQWTCAKAITVKLINNSKDLTFSEKSLRNEQIIRLQNEIHVLESNILSGGYISDDMFQSSYLSFRIDSYYNDTRRKFILSENEWNSTAVTIFNQMQLVIL